jgi:glycosyltransferase involved in cell wall biosynthesis
MHETVTVSIGLPVHNGERHVAEAIESILAQTFADFELIISDNASTDATPSICQAYAARDRRVRYHRQERNVGASQNFNFVFHQSRGRYFKWAAHDDLIRPRFLEKCLAALEANPDAILCQSLVEVIDHHNLRTELYDHTAFGTDRPCPSDRLAARLRARRCMDVFGVIRREALQGTALIANHVGADRTLLIELALRGRFVGVPEALFVNRDHPNRFTRRLQSLHSQAQWYVPHGPKPRILRTWVLYDTCLRVVRRAVTDRAERRRCYLRIIASIAYRRGWFRLVMEPIEAIQPRASRIEPWLFGLAASLKHAARRRIASAIHGETAGATEASPPKLPL